MRKENESVVAITTFRHKGLRAFFYSENKSGIQPAHRKRIKLILDLLDGASEVKDMNFPGSNFHSLRRYNQLLKMVNFSQLSRTLDSTELIFDLWKQNLSF